MSILMPTVATIIIAAAFLVAERLAPGRILPDVRGWHERAIFINACQIAISFATNALWFRLLAGQSLLQLGSIESPAIQGFIGWFVGTFVFYWWHRLRHVRGFWQMFHQIHHSPARIEALTSFYKHPVEILADAALAAVVLYVVLGVSYEGALWFNFFAATGEFFYHSNFRSPCWLKYLIQTPELHSIHHELDVHRYNFGDLPLWDRLFGTYLDADQFAERCGFPGHNEKYLGRMLLFEDVYTGLSRRPVPLQKTIVEQHVTWRSSARVHTG